MFMKRIFSVLIAVFTGVAAFAQTTEEIFARMEQAMQGQQDKGLYMVMEMKIPILGTAGTQAWVLGDKTKMIISGKGASSTIFLDGKTQWTYNPDKNEIEIANQTKTSTSSNPQDNTEMLTGITDGYDITLKSETAEAWNFVCKKSKTNKNKDDPKSMDVSIAKNTYYPKSLSTKASGITITMRDFHFDVTEKDVTFNQSDYPNAKVIDKR